MKHYQNNVSDYSESVDYVGQSLPAFPYQVLASGLSTNFYLRNAGTLNITAMNSSGQDEVFQYIIKARGLNKWNISISI